MFGVAFVGAEIIWGPLDAGPEPGFVVSGVVFVGDVVVVVVVDPPPLSGGVDPMGATVSNGASVVDTGAVVEGDGGNVAGTVRTTGVGAVGAFAVRNTVGTVGADHPPVRAQYSLPLAPSNAVKYSTELL
jgi:hypothetical protein